MASKRKCEFCGKMVFGANHEYNCKSKKKKEIIPVIHEQTNSARFIKCGKNYIDPSDIACIREVKNGLFIVKLKSEPNPTYPIWLKESEINSLLPYLNIISD